MRRCCFAVLVVVFVLIVSPFGSTRRMGASPVPVEESEQRKPFALELPEIRSGQITAAEVSVPTAELRTVRIRIKQPYADEINYGKIYTKVNGESAGVIQSVRGSSEGHIVTCDLGSRPRFKLQPGKNVIEINAIDRRNRSYYASYVLLTGGRPLADANVAAGVTIESTPVTEGDDRQPPTILLQQPKGVLRLAGDTGTVKVEGGVTDGAGEIASVTINGEDAPLVAAPANTRGLLAELNAQSAAAAPINSSAFAFTRTVQIGAQVSAVVVEAKDRAGNVSRLSLPVRRREPAVSARFRGRKFALIVGVSRYKYPDGGLKNLAYPDADARSVRDFLRRPEGGGFAASDISYLENEQATLEGVRAALKSFLPQAAPTDLIFIFIAGHGAPDPYAPQNLYFLLHDTRISDMPNTALPMKELQDLLDQSVRAERVVVFIDTCHSAGLSGGTLTATRGLENNLINLYAARLYTETGRAVLTSSDVSELSQESTRWGGGHGVFTWALLEGLRGEADANSDQLITAGELFTFVRDRVRLETAFRQNPRALTGLNTELALAAVASKR